MRHQCPEHLLRLLAELGTTDARRSNQVVLDDQRLRVVTHLGHALLHGFRDLGYGGQDRSVVSERQLRENPSCLGVFHFLFRKVTQVGCKRIQHAQLIGGFDEHGHGAEHVPCRAVDGQLERSLL